MYDRPLKLDQTRLHNPPESIGNCFATVVACLVHMAIDEVPAVEKLMPDVGNDSQPDYELSWVDIMTAWLNEHGYSWYVLEEWQKDEYYIAVGPSPRGVNHCCIYLNGDLYHDPHPSRAGLVEVKTMEVITTTPS